MIRDRDYLKEKFKKNIKEKVYIEKPSGKFSLTSLITIPSDLFDNKLKNLGYVYEIGMESEIHDLKYKIYDKYKINLGLCYCRQLREEYGSTIKALNRISDIPEERFNEIIYYIGQHNGFYTDIGDDFIIYITNDNIEIPKIIIEPIQYADYLTEPIYFSEYPTETLKNIEIPKDNKEEITIKTKIKNFFKQILK